MSKLAVKAKEAAEMLSISERTLATLTASKQINVARAGKALLYPVKELEAWLERNTNTGDDTP